MPDPGGSVRRPHGLSDSGRSPLLTAPNERCWHDWGTMTERSQPGSPGPPDYHSAIPFLCKRKSSSSDLIFGELPNISQQVRSPVLMPLGRKLILRAHADRPPPQTEPVSKQSAARELSPFGRTTIQCAHADHPPPD